MDSNRKRLVERKILGEQARVTLKAGFAWKSVQGSMGFYPIIGAGRNSDAQWPRIFRADDTPCTLCKSFLCSLLARAFIERLSFVERTWYLGEIVTFQDTPNGFSSPPSIQASTPSSNSIVVKVTLFFPEFLFSPFSLKDQIF